MVQAMKISEFEKLLSLHGHELSTWPEEYQKSAFRVAETAEGQALIEAEKQLDNLMAASLAAGHEHIDDHNLEAFLSRLETIPDNHKQEPVVSFGWFESIRKFLSSLEIEVSVPILVSQMAVLVVALGVGIMVGFSADIEALQADENIAEIDISGDWFVEEEEFDRPSEIGRG